ncbi:RNA polymerase sigma-F factor [Clostridium neonatale]|nr:RNA polymerase sigma-F factor [Clostridium neonatale]CAI3627205.1 RNA polymerase sigma-F factor [Clostridium neonatale]CAI4142176.1 RNA polymerase sigma-F factor [Clostridium neonatale]
MKDMGNEDRKREAYNYDHNPELLNLAKNGDSEAMNKLIEMNLPLVMSISKKFLNRGYEYEDIFQIGSIGLVKAINNFNTDYNVKFSTYAVPMIIGEIKRFLRDDGMIKVSRNVKSLARKISIYKEQLSKTLQRSPTIEELAEYAGVDKEEIIFAIESANSLQYLYDTIHQDDGAPVLLIDKLSEEKKCDDNLIERIALKEALRSLDEKARQIIMLRYFKDKTQVQVAKMLGISQVQVSRIEKKVLAQMKKRLEE